MRKKKTVLNVVSSLILQFVTIVSGFIIPKLIISSFGTNINGLVSSATQFLSYISLLEAGIAGVARSVLYEPLSRNDSEEISAIIHSIKLFFKKIAIIFICYLLILSLSFYFISGSTLDYLSTCLLVIIIGISSFVQYYFCISYQILLQADQKRYINSFIQIVTICINSVLVYVAIKLGFDILFVKLFSTLVFVLRPLLINIYVRNKYKINSKITAKFDLKQKYDGLAHHIAYFLHSNTDIVIITIFLNVSYVSVYSVYNMICKGLSSLSLAFSSSAEAAFGNMLAKKEFSNLSMKFEIVEFVSSSVSTILFSAAFLLIDDFIKLYTNGFIDFNYHKPFLGIFLLIAEFIYCIRQPFHSLVIAYGDFKNTKNAAWLEALINILLSIIFVLFIGVEGVAIATAIAMAYRTIYYVNYIKKNIIYRKKSRFFIDRVLTTIIIVGVMSYIFKNVFIINVSNYLMWFIKAIIICITISIFTILISLVFYREQINYLIKYIKSIMKRIMQFF